MPFAYRARLILRRRGPSPAQGLTCPGPEPTPALAPNNDHFQEFMQTCIKKVQDQSPAAPAAPIPLAAEA